MSQIANESLNTGFGGAGGRRWLTTSNFERGRTLQRMMSSHSPNARGGTARVRMIDLYETHGIADPDGARAHDVGVERQLIVKSSDDIA